MRNIFVCNGMRRQFGVACHKPQFVLVEAHRVQYLQNIQSECQTQSLDMFNTVASLRVELLFWVALMLQALCITQVM